MRLLNSGGSAQHSTYGNARKEGPLAELAVYSFYDQETSDELSSTTTPQLRGPRECVLDE